ncbi:MAG: helix-turn-helix transcriptional regulator [Eubacterium sp.]|nr:helix-turn-helix transcriptional regulator [Eubacterium sp.]
MFQYEADRHYTVSLRVGICEMQPCGNDVQKCWEAAKDLTGHAFYNRGTSFYGWQMPPMGNTLPQKAQDFLDVLPEMIARRDQDAVRETCESVLQTFMKEQTKETLVIGWIRNTDRIFQLEMQPVPKHFREMEECVRRYVSACGERLPDTGEYSESVAMVIRYIQKNYADNISLNDAAESVHLTTTYLSYIFHKETDITFSEYLQSCRIDRARELLEHTDEKVREIGQMVGYNDNRHFSKTFKKVTGVTPLEYRKMRRR